MLTSPSTCSWSAGPSRPAWVIPSFTARLRPRRCRLPRNANGLVRDYDRLRPTLGEIVSRIYSRSVEDIRVCRPSSLLSVPWQRLNMLNDVTSLSSLRLIGPLFSLPRLPSLTRSSSMDPSDHMDGTVNPDRALGLIRTCLASINARTHGPSVIRLYS